MKKEELLSEVNDVLLMYENTELYCDGDMVDLMYDVLLSVKDYLKRD